VGFRALAFYFHMKKETKQNWRLEYAHEIQQMLRYRYKDEWVPEKLFVGKSRLWMQVFNDLVNEGFILRKKEYPGYKYKWAVKLPEI